MAISISHEFMRRDALVNKDALAGPAIVEELPNLARNLLIRLEDALARRLAEDSLKKKDVRNGT